MTTKHRTTGHWLALVALAVGGVGLAGCSSHSLSGTDSLAPAARSTTTMDGFVFVPSRTRQTAEGDTTIPHALISVYVLPRQSGAAPIRTGQANEQGFYRLEDLGINVPLLVIAVDPFDPNRRLQGVISFESETQEKRRNLTPTSTLAAQVVVDRGTTSALSDSQVSALEQIAADQLEGTDVDITLLSNGSAFEQLAQQAGQASFGDFEVSVFFQSADDPRPTVATSVFVNGQLQGVVQALPADPVGRQTVDGHRLTLLGIPVGTAFVRLAAEGFLDDVFAVDIVGGELATRERTLTRAPRPGENSPPNISEATVTPTRLPFQGGTVALRLLVADPDADPVTGEAQIRRTGENGQASVEVATIPLVRSGNALVGQFAAPGNPHTFDQTYTVIFVVRDNHDGVTRRFRAFQVAALLAPPPPPEPDEATGARRLIGRWLELRRGPDFDHLTSLIGVQGVLSIKADATFSVVDDFGQIAGRVQFSALPVGRPAEETFHFALIVEQSSGPAAPPVGTVIPTAATVTADNQHLLTLLFVGLPQQIANEWLREQTAE